MKRASLSALWINPARITSRKEETLTETTKQVVIRLSSFALRRGIIRGHAGSLTPESQDYRTAKHHFRKAQTKQFADKTQSTVSACMKNSDKYETMDSWDGIAGRQKKPTNRRRSKDRRDSAISGNLVQTTAGGSNTMLHASKS